MEPVQVEEESPQKTVTLLSVHSAPKSPIPSKNAHQVYPKSSDPLPVPAWIPKSPTAHSRTRSRSRSPIPDLNQDSEQRLHSARLKAWDDHNRPIPTQQMIRDHKSKHPRAILNVGGKKHEILCENLSRYPQTRLGRLKDSDSHEKILQFCEDYDLESNEYFFDWQPDSFSAILNLYRKAKLHFPEDICVIDFAEDLAYWGIDQIYMDPCCRMKYQQKMDALNEDLKKDEEFVKERAPDDFGSGACSVYQQFIWDLFENSDTIPQKVVGMMSIFTIVLSIVTLSLSTIPDLQDFSCRPRVDPTICDEILEDLMNQSLPIQNLPDEYFETSDNDILDKLELYCIIWFTTEYLLRLLTAPSKKQFFKGVLNNIDLVAIAPFYVSLFLVQFDTPGRLLQTLRVIRILRIFKLARHSVGLQSLGFTLRHSYQNLGVLLLFLTVGVVIFSTLAYFAEKDANKNGFESIPHAFYWALITMTTVGYGDVTPTTLMGRIVGMMTGVCGVIVIALPIPIVVNNFALFYEEQKKKEKAIKRQKDLQALKDSDTARGIKRNYLPVSVHEQHSHSSQDL